MKLNKGPRRDESMQLCFLMDPNSVFYSYVLCFLAIIGSIYSFFAFGYLIFAFDLAFYIFLAFSCFFILCYSECCFLREENE